MIRRTAHAKLNFTLAILGRRADGFHELESWVVPIAWSDDLHFESADEFSLVVESSDIGPLAGDETNLVHRAAHALASAAGRSPGAHIRLTKNIPIGGGLGGGSSDAAATLSALNELWNLKWPVERLFALGAAVGSDVPFFLEQGQAILRGRGDVLSRIDGWQGWAAVVVPPFGVSTAEVYRCHARRAARALEPAAPRARTPWIAGPMHADQLLQQLFNDLEAAAFEFEPRLSELHARLSHRGGRPVRMTGSGSCLFTLFDDEIAARAWGEVAEPILVHGGRIKIVRVLG